MNENKYNHYLFMLVKNIICPYCGAELLLDLEPEEAPVYLSDCSICGGTFKITKEQLEQLVKETKRETDKMVPNHQLSCPVCRSNYIGLWNSRKQIYHCHMCENYFYKDGTIVDVSDENKHRRDSRGRGNGYTDPNDFPTDGFDGGGW